jgi:hypothetical protein
MASDFVRFNTEYVSELASLVLVFGGKHIHWERMPCAIVHGP